MSARTAILLLLGLVGIGAAVYYYEAQIKELSQLTYQIVAFSVPEASLSLVTINLVLRITSQSTLDAQVTGLSIDVYLGGKKMGNISSQQPFVIPAKGYSDAPLTISFSPSLLASDAVSLLTNFSASSDIAITLVGYVGLKEAFLSFSVPFSYSTSLKQITS